MRCGYALCSVHHHTVEQRCLECEDAAARAYPSGEFAPAVGRIFASAYGLSLAALLVTALHFGAVFLFLVPVANLFSLGAAVSIARGRRRRARRRFLRERPLIYADSSA